MEAVTTQPTELQTLKLETVQLIREPYRPGQSATLGWLRAGDLTLCTLELPWLGNERSVSCIPEGAYTTTYLPRSASGKYRRVYHLQDVPGRGGILLHAGNTASHSWGCMLVGTRHGVLGNRRAVLRSRSALELLRTQIGESPFTLEVTYV